MKVNIDLQKKQVAEFFEIDDRTVERYTENNKAEFEESGYEILTGNRLKDFKLAYGTDTNVGTIDESLKKTSVLGVFTFRAFLNIGIYYFKSGETLRAELQHLLDNNVIKGGEYQLTDALENMKQKGLPFVPGKVDEWMDCGNKNVTVDTNSRLLNFLMADGQNLVSDSVISNNSTIIQPCFIGENVVPTNSTVGPNVSIGHDCTVTDSAVRNSLIQNHSHIHNANIDNAMIGNHAKFDGNFSSISIGDYSVLE